MGDELNINQITAEVITDLAKSTAQSVFNEVKKYFVDLKNKEEIDFGYAFEEYLIYTKGVHSKIKTLLFRHTPKDIYSFYECSGLKYGRKTIDTSDINHILELGHKCIITGTGGIGKSVMMKHLFLNTMEKTSLIPILIELRGLNDLDIRNLDLVAYIYSVMETYKFKLKKEYFQYSLESGCYLILLDGYDEVKNTISNKVTKAIADLCDKYPDNYYIMSSRPLEEFVGWNGFEELQVMPLTKEQALSLINKLDYECSVKNRFYKVLKDGLYDKYKSFASNPLLLTIMLITFESRGAIPDKLNDFYEQAFTTLFHAHDEMKGGYQRDILSKLGYEDFKMIFSYFCFKSFFASEYKFSESQIISYLSLAKRRKIIAYEFDSLGYLNDLTNAVCMLVRDGLEYRFSHRSFQEYFAALYTTQLSDEQQKNFISQWLKENSHRSTSNYLDMLYELQPTRFIMNVLYPGLSEFRALYHDNNESMAWLVQELYRSIIIRSTTGEDKERCYVTIANDYYIEVIERACSLAGYYCEERVKNKKQLAEEEDRAAIALLRKYDDGQKEEFSVKDLNQDGILEELLTFLKWIPERFEYALKFIEEYEYTSLSRKKKFSSMFEEL